MIFFDAVFSRYIIYIYIRERNVEIVSSAKDALFNAAPPPSLAAQKSIQSQTAPGCEGTRKWIFIYNRPAFYTYYISTGSLYNWI